MTATLRPPERLLHAEPEERDSMAALRDLLASVAEGTGVTRLLGPNGEQIELPAAAFEALQAVAQAMAAGQTITLIPHDQELTTQQAADLLHVSRPHLVKLLERGDLPFHRVGTHRRVLMEDLLAYRARRAQERRRQLDELTRLSDELGYL
jgi:excisionase family DNA binding protein